MVLNGGFIFSFFDKNQFFRMKYFSLFFLLFLAYACEETTSTTNTPTAPSPEAIPPNAQQTPKKIDLKADCPLNGELLEENQVFLKEQAKILRIIADSSTFDNRYGESHRILELYDLHDCKLDLRLTLPVNKSPDFPYYLADINYNNDSKVVAIKGAETIYCFDVKAQRMLPTLVPKFKTKRVEVDASSGQIVRLELWENFLIGYAQDKGVFVFNIQNLAQPRPMLPFAEFALGETQFSSLFLLPSGKQQYQAILPDYDWENETFSINPLFKKPVDLSQEISKSALDNRFIVLRQLKNNQAVAIDMQKKINFPMPDDIKVKSTKEILSWLRKQ